MYNILILQEKISILIKLSTDTNVFLRIIN